MSKAPVNEKTTIVKERIRTPNDLRKIDALCNFLKLGVANEDIEPIFEAVYSTSKELGYQFKGTFRELMISLETTE